jgi:uncharacterized iron-regulated protein
MKCILWAAILFPLSVIAQVTEKDYRIFDVKANKEVSVKDIAERMENFDVLFYGEEHNDSVTHYLEKTIFEALYNRFSSNTALSMEMFDRDVQVVIDEYLSGAIREKSFLKDARAWSNYRDYKPMIEFAKEKGLAVVCANAASRYTNLAGRKGQIALGNLPEASKANFAPLPYDTASGAYYDKLTGVTHEAPSSTKDTLKPQAPIMPMGMGGFNLITAQSLWDATMAYSISEYRKHNKKKKLMQVNGRFHSDERYAVVAQLRKYSPKTKVLVISSGTDKAFPNILWSQYLKDGDYVIITNPAVPRTYKE